MTVLFSYIFLYADNHSPTLKKKSYEQNFIYHDRNKR